MKINFIRVLLVTAIALVVATGAAPAKEKAQPTGKAPAKQSTVQKTRPAAKKKGAVKVAKALPRLLDLGSTKCIPCKMMTTVLDELAKDYGGKLKVEFIDVQKNPKMAQKYKVSSIPTQVFYDEKGREFFRHVGYYPKDEVLAAFKKHGIDLNKAKKPGQK
ncbi:MAG: thioredoxin family protein [Armatimonadetes bacterium]|nr:thioredoxin family protein [Armatimonadota bacterium]